MSDVNNIMDELMQRKKTVASDIKVRLIEANRKFSPLLVHNKKIISNGEENNTPYWIKYFTEESATAKTALQEYKRYTFGDVDRNQQGIEIYNNAVDSFCTQGGVFLNVNYRIGEFGEDGEPTFVPCLETSKVLPYESMRLSKDLEDENSFFYEADWISAEAAYDFDSLDKGTYYPYNPKAVLEQMKRDYEESQKNLSPDRRTEFTIQKGLKVYKGQVAFLNPSNMHYPLSPFYAAMGAMRTEVNADSYEARTIGGGFMEKNLFMLASQDSTMGNDIRKAIEELITNPDTSSIVLQTSDLDVNLKDYLQKYELKSQFDDKVMTNALARAEKNIIKCANNIPSILINPTEGVFGNSGEAFKVAEEIYSKKCEPDRELIISFLNEKLGIEIKSYKL